MVHFRLPWRDSWDVGHQNARQTSVHVQNFSQIRLISFGGDASLTDRQTLNNRQQTERLTITMQEMIVTSAKGNTFDYTVDLRKPHCLTDGTPGAIAIKMFAVFHHAMFETDLRPVQNFSHIRSVVSEAMRPKQQT